MSTNILAKIVASKFGEVAERKKQISIAQLEAMPLFEQKAYYLKRKQHILKHSSNPVLLFL